LYPSHHIRPATALPFSGVGAARLAPRFYTMSRRRPHPLQRLVGQRSRDMDEYTI